jgi:hypothetical protein
MRQRKQTYHTPGKPTVTELREDFRGTPIIKLGRLGMWNLLTRQVVDLRNPTLGVLKTALPEVFDDLVNSKKPVFAL